MKHRGAVLVGKWAAGDSAGTSTNLQFISLMKHSIIIKQSQKDRYLIILLICGVILREAEN
jgi:hypothetical protein